MMGSASDPDATRAERMGAVAFLRLRRDDLARAVEEHPSPRPVGNIVVFPGVRREREPEPAAPVYEDPRWADLHKPE